ncbi:MAG: C39 family peptidase [Candidatus Limnocylindria bacterium]
MRQTLKGLVLVLGVFAMSFATAVPASADPDDQWKNGELGPATFTPEERKLAALELARSERVAGTLRPRTTGADGEIGIASCCTIYETVSVPTDEQEQDTWCGPATIKVMLLTPRIDQYNEQSALATEMGTDSGGTYVYKMREALNDHTIYDPAIAPQMPANWFWLEYQVADVSDFVARHREDLGESLPTVFNVKGESNDGNYSLVGWSSNGWHYVTGHGYREGDLVLDVQYTDSYQDPVTLASLGAHWFDAYPMYILVRDNKSYIVY